MKPGQERSLTDDKEDKNHNNNNITSRFPRGEVALPASLPSRHPTTTNNIMKANPSSPAPRSNQNGVGAGGSRRGLRYKELGDTDPILSVAAATSSHVTSMSGDSSDHRGDEGDDASSSSSETVKKNRTFKERCKVIAATLKYLKERFCSKAEETFGKWGLITYNYPYTIMLASVIICILTLFGLFRARWIDGADALYALPHTKAREDGAIHDAIYKKHLSRASFITVTSDPPGRNIFTWEDLAYLYRVDLLVRGRDVDHAGGRKIAIPTWPEFKPEYRNDGSGNTDPTILTYEDICLTTPFGTCQVQSPFEMGVYEVRAMLPDQAPPELYIMEGKLVFNTMKKGFVSDFVLGDMEAIDCVRELPTAVLSEIYTPDQLSPGDSPGNSKAKMQCITSAKSIQMIYEVDARPEFVERAEAWEYLFYNILKGNEQFGTLRVGANAFRSRDDELRNATSESDDVIFVLFTFLLLITYAVITNFSMNLYRNRGFSALAGSLATTMGLASAYGFLPLFGVAFVPTALVCPFLVLGVGADDVFCIVNSFSIAYGTKCAKERLYVTMKDCGLSMTMTTITNCLAFAIGSASHYLSIKNFCMFSLAGLMFSYFYEMTLFLAVLALDARREELQKTFFLGLPAMTARDKAWEREKRHGTFNGAEEFSTFKLMNAHVEQDWAYRSEFVPLECLTWSRLRRRFTFPASIVAAYIHQGNNSYIRQRKETGNGGIKQLVPLTYCAEPKGNVGSGWRRFWRNWYCVWVLQPWAKILCLIVFLIIFSLGVYGMMHVEEGLELKDLSPDGSYLKVYDAMMANYFTQYDLPVEIFFAKPAPWWDERAIRCLRLLDHVFSEKPGVFVDTLTRMIDDVQLNEALTSGNEKIFLSTLRSALTTPGSKYKQFENDFKWSDDGKILESFRMQSLPGYMANSKERAAWMITMREELDWLASLKEYNGEEVIPLEAIAYNYMMIIYESDLTIISEAVSHVVVALGGMLLVALVVIPDILSAVLVLAVIFTTDIAVIGFMYFSGVKLNMISMITLVISIGFAVDYSALVCYTFAASYGKSRNLRTTECVTLTGNPVFHGAMSNMLGVLMLGFSSSYIFRIFFKMMGLVIVFGITHGLILLPVLLSICGKMSESTKSMAPFDPDYDIVRLPRLGLDDVEDEDSPHQRYAVDFGEMTGVVPQHHHITGDKDNNNDSNRLEPASYGEELDTDIDDDPPPPNTSRGGDGESPPPRSISQQDTPKPVAKHR